MAGPGGLRLPIEIILRVLSSYVIDRPRAILPPVRSETKAILAFTLVCYATYAPASRYLREHCVHLASSSRLRDLLVCLERPAMVRSLGASTSGIYITALFLAPFGPSLDDLPTAMWVRELFCVVGRSLRRLVVDLPLRSLSPADDHLDVRKALRDAFCRLTVLEEFVSVRDELYCMQRQEVWSPGRASTNKDQRPVWKDWAVPSPSFHPNITSADSRRRSESVRAGPPA